MKRSAMPQRTKPLVRTPGPARGEIKLPKCAAPGCRVRFVPERKTQEVCSVDCGQRLGTARADKERRRQAKAAQLAAKLERQTIKERRAALKRLPDLRREAQSDFNAYIRERDRQAGWGCICCGRPLQWDSGIVGGKVDAGHYIARGGAPELAFDERNVNAQAKSCNRPGGANRAEFRAGMLARWGRAAVEQLEGPHPMTRYRRDDYLRLSEIYKAKLRSLRASGQKPSPSSGSQLGACIL